jgi:hypothetical protein
MAAPSSMIKWQHLQELLYIFLPLSDQRLLLKNSVLGAALSFLKAMMISATADM